MYRLRQKGRGAQINFGDLTPYLTFGCHLYLYTFYKIDHTLSQVAGVLHMSIVAHEAHHTKRKIYRFLRMADVPTSTLQ
jgi:hypothetical protein